MPRQLFTGIFALSLFLSACMSPSGGSPAIPQPTLPLPTALTATAQALPIPSAEAGDNNPTAAQPTPKPVQLPDPAAYTWAQIVSGITSPTDIRNAGDGSGRLFIVEQPGQIRILKNGQLLNAPFLDIRDRVGSNGSERGLLGLAFHPKFAKNGYFYVNYTDSDGNTHIARFTASADSVDPASEVQLIFVKQLVEFPVKRGRFKFLLNLIPVF